LFKKYKMATLASLTGFMLWSLNKIWPWKDTVYSEWWVWRNILPNQFEALTGESNQLLWAIICFIIWVCIVLLIEFLGKKFSKKD
jgi:putative membrane protein